jgi:hypothetical protein
LAQDRAKAKPERSRKLDAGTLVNLLLEPGALSDAEALQYLDEMSPSDGRRVLERLSRLVPERAGPLLRGWKQQGELSGGTFGPKRDLGLPIGGTGMGAEMEKTGKEQALTRGS